MLFDILGAESMVGTVDDCLFSVHKPQTKDLSIQKELQKNWSKLSNMKLYGLPIKHLNNGVDGPFGWIKSGTVDLDLHFLVPHTFHDDDLFDKILDEVDGIREVAMVKLESVMSIPSTAKSMITLKDMRTYGLKYALKKKKMELSNDQDLVKSEPDINDINPDSGIVMLWKVNLKDLKASVPLVNESLTYIDNALIRPVVGYMNSNRTSIKLSLSAKMDKVFLINQG
jgi:distribution and morphology protein 31